MTQITRQRIAKTPSFTTDRQGAATVELVFSLSLLILLTVGSIEVCNLIYLKQSLVQTSYDGAMRALRPDVTEADVRLHMEELLAVRNIAGATISIRGATGNFDDLERGETILIGVRASPAGNVSVVPWLIPLSDIVAEVAGRKQ